MAWSIIDANPVVLAAAKQPVRQQIYSSLASSSGSLLGFTIAAVTILAAFGQVKMPSREQRGREKDLAKAREIVSGALLVSALLLLAVLLVSTVLIGVDSSEHAPETWIIIDLSLSLGAVLGLIIGGFGLALAILERNRLVP
ncbi:hypothetical protein AB0K15_13145 [Amycolatopsis sp. NPDC049253]|uniref:hypothetical protein n=1 Tax=Amycolatopsis sp. NPDC049253 TaxID=3155274 RepID=UPI00342AD674